MRGVHDQGTGTRWAEELREGPLQGLAAVRLLLAMAVDDGSPQSLQRAAAASLRQVETEITSLRAMVAEMGTAPAEAD